MPHTVNLCRNCFDCEQGDDKVNNAVWKEVIKQKILETAAGKRNHHTAKRCMEELELLREIKNLRFDGSSMRQVFEAGNAGDWADFLKHGKLGLWAGVRVCENATVRWSN